MIDKLVGVVVTYNPDNSVIYNIMSYLNHLHYLLVVDNSDTERDFSKLNFRHNRLIVARNPHNLGIGYALNYAASHFSFLGYKWMLTMDQDSFFSKSIFEKYVDTFEAYCKADSIAMIGLEIVPEGLSPEFNPDSIQIIRENLLITSGSIVNLEIWNILNGFEEKLFIDEIDHDYCLKALKAGFFINKIKGIYLDHNLGKSVFISGRQGISRKIIHSPFRLYYIVRNGLFLNKKFKKEFPHVCASRFKILIITLKNNLIYGNRRIQRLNFIFLGFFHFIRGKYGKLK